MSGRLFADRRAIDLGTGKLVVLSGITAEGSGVGPDVTKQAEVIFERMRSQLQAEGGGLEHLVSLTLFMTDLRDLPALREVRRRYLPHEPLPTSTLVEVNKLVPPECRIEIEGMAVIPISP